MLKLVTTDFDGTSIGFTPKESCVEALALALKKINDDKIYWAICTGRDFDYLLEGLEHFNPPVQPDFIITSERYIYYREKEEWRPFVEWNERCDFLHEEFFSKNRSFFEQIKTVVEKYHPSVTWLENDRGIAETLLTDCESLLDKVVLELWSLPQRPADFSFQRSRTHLRFCHHHYDKGTALRALSSFLSLQPENILAIGDHYNDLTMLDGQVATMVACPSNAHDDVKAAVRKIEGYISESAAGEGTAEGIYFYYQKINEEVS